MKRSLAVLVTTALALLLTAVPAGADTRTVTDGHRGSPPALDIVSGTFRHGEQKVVARVRFARVDRQRTALVVKYLRRDGTTTQVLTTYAGGGPRVAVHRYDADSYERLPSRDVQVRWNVTDDVIRVVIGRPLLRGRVADFYAWSQPRGALEGSPGGRDHLYAGRLRRG